MNTPPEPGSAEAAWATGSRGLAGMLRRYRRQFFRARDAGEGLGTGHKFNLELKWDEASGLAGKLDLPPEPKLMRWIMNMRPLLDPASPVNIKKVWLEIKTTFPDQIPPERIDAVDRMLARLAEHRPIKFTHNDRDITAADAYELVASRAFWTSDVEAIKFRTEFLDVPGHGTLYEYLFYDYQLVAYNVAAAVLGHVKQVEQRPLGLAPQCIYCLSTEGEFSADEHVIPEMFGNDEVVLPPEFACKACNHALAKLDEYIVDSPFGMARVYYAGPGKDGNMQKIRFADQTLEQVNPHKFRVTHYGVKQRKVVPDADGKYRFSIVGKSRKKFDERTAGRAFFKMALGMLAFKHGRNLACSPRYEEARRFIRYGGPFPNAFLVFRKGFPNCPTVRMTWRFGEGTPPHATTTFQPRGTIFEINLYGARIGLNLEALPILVPADPADVKWLI